MGGRFSGRAQIHSPSYVGCLEACKLLLEIVRSMSVDAPDIYSRRWFFLVSFQSNNELSISSTRSRHVLVWRQR